MIIGLGDNTYSGLNLMGGEILGGWNKHQTLLWKCN